MLCSVNDAVNVLDCSTGVYLNGGPLLTCSTFTRRRWLSGRPQPTDLAVGGSNPSRRATKAAGHRPAGRLLAAVGSPDCDQTATTWTATPSLGATTCDHDDPLSASDCESAAPEVSSWVPRGGRLHLVMWIALGYAITFHTARLNSAAGGDETQAVGQERDAAPSSARNHARSSFPAPYASAPVSGSPREASRPWTGMPASSSAQAADDTGHRQQRMAASSCASAAMAERRMARLTSPECASATPTPRPRSSEKVAYLQRKLIGSHASAVRLWSLRPARRRPRRRPWPRPLPRRCGCVERSTAGSVNRLATLCR